MIRILVLLLFITPALAHDWFPPECCNGQDCKPVSCDELIDQDDGSVKWNNYTFPSLRVHPSQDRHCYVCIYSVNGMPLCAFIQQQS